MNFKNTKRLNKSISPGAERTITPDCSKCISNIKIRHKRIDNRWVIAYAWWPFF